MDLLGGGSPIIINPTPQQNFKMPDAGLGGGLNSTGGDGLLDLLGGLDLSTPAPAPAPTIQPQPNPIQNLMDGLGSLQQMTQTQPIMGQNDLLGGGGLINNTGEC